MANTEDATRLHLLGKYRIEAILGQGAMGIVYKAFDTAIERYVALKTMRTDLLADASGDWLARFKREVQAAGRCLHPNIVTIFEYGEDRGVPYIAMEYLQGQELKHYLTGQIPFPLGTALRIIAQVLQALEYAHAQGIVHRDIKPGNIILIANNQVKVTDFGIARLNETGLTQQGMAIGTPDYMAPEQFTGRPITPATDLYAVGLMLFELLSGAKPFGGKTPTEIMYRVLSDRPKALAELNPQAPAALQTVLDKALAKDAGHRFQNAREFINALLLAAPEAFKEARDQAAAPAEPLTTAATPAASASSVIEPALAPALTPAALREAETQLAVFVGPVAKVMLKRASRQAASIAELYRTLADGIGAEMERKLFLEKVKPLLEQSGPQTTTTAAASSGGGSFKPPALERVAQELTVYLGPIAGVLVRKTAGQVNSLEQLYQRLALHIPNEKERAAFLDKTRRSIQG